MIFPAAQRSLLNSSIPAFQHLTDGLIHEKQVIKQPDLLQYRFPGIEEGLVQH